MKIYERNQFNKESKDKYFFFEKSLCKTLIKQSTPKFLSSSNPLWHISKMYITTPAVTCIVFVSSLQFESNSNLSFKTRSQRSHFYTVFNIFPLLNEHHIYLIVPHKQRKYCQKYCRVQYLYITYKIDLCIRFTA